MQSRVACAIVLAGGHATRLYPLTLNRPKPLLPVAGKPIIDYVVDLLAQAGPDTIIVSTNKRFKPDFDAQASRLPIKVDVVAEEAVREEQKPGAVRALYQVAQEYTGYDTYLVIGGNLLTLSLREMLELHYRTGKPVIAAYTLRDVREASRYGVIESTVDGTIARLVEKPRNPKSNLIAACCYALPAATPKLLEEYLEAEGKPDAPGYFIEWLVHREQTLAYRFKGIWYDIGTPRAQLEANMALTKHMISENARVEGSPTSESMIESGAHIVASTAQSSYIGHEARVYDIRQHQEITQ